MLTNRLKPWMRPLLGMMLIATLSLPASAQSGAPGGIGGSQKVIQTITTREVANLLGAAGFTELEIDKDDDIVVKMQGYKVLLMVGTNQYRWLLFKFAVEGTALDVKALNDWNRSVKYSRAYIDEDGDAILESDQDLAGGVTPQRIREFARSFDLSLKEFIKRLK